MKRKSLLILSTAVFLAFAAERAQAQTYETSCGSGSWFQGNCWWGADGGTPADGDLVYMNTSDAGYTVTYDANASVSLDGLVVGYEHGPGSSTLRITAPGAFIEAGYIWVGHDPGLSSGFAVHGSVMQEAGNVSTSSSVDGLLSIGYSNVGTSSYTLTGGNLHTGRTVVGSAGSGTFTHDGATGSDVNHFADTLTIASQEGSHGVYNLGPGRLTSETQIIGNAGTGEFIQSAPLNSYNSTGSLTVGYQSAGVGTYTMQGGWLSAGSETIGDGGTGTFTHWGGLNDVAGDLTIGDFTDPTSSFSGDFTYGIGTYSMRETPFSGNPELRAHNEYVGNYGTGYFEQFGGTNTVAGGLYIGARSIGSNSGTYVLDGGGTLSAADVVVGHNGVGTFTQHSGTSTISSSLVVGKYAGSVGTYNMNYGTLQSDSLTVGQDGTGVFNHTDGSNSLSWGVGIVNVGSGTGTGTYNMSGGSLSGTYLNIGTGSGTGSSTSAVNHTGGYININETVTIGANGTYNMSESEGGSWLAPSLYAGSIVNDGTVNFNGGRIETAGGRCSYCGEGPAVTDIVNNGTINIGGPGERYMTGNIVNNGTMKITDTTVVFNKDFLNNGAYLSDPSSNYFSNLTVGSNGYLVGGVGDNFFINDDFLNYSTQTGLWDTADAYLGFIGWNSHEFHLGGWDEASSMTFAWDTLELSEYGNLFLSGGLGASLYVDNLILGANSTLDLSGFNIYYSTLTNLGGSFSGGQLIQLASNTGGGSTSVPEPSSLLLLASGVAGLIGARRLKRFRN